MTREEAINALRCLITMPGFTANEALDMAIAALREQDALLAEIKDMCHLCRHYHNGAGDEACPDCSDDDNFEWRGAKEEV